jgi:hypothetical protein
MASSHTGAGLLDLPFGLFVFGLIKHTLYDVFKGTSSEKKNSQNNLPALAYLYKKITLMFFIAICLQKELVQCDLPCES